MSRTSPTKIVSFFLKLVQKIVLQNNVKGVFKSETVEIKALITTFRRWSKILLYYIYVDSNVIPQKWLLMKYVQQIGVCVKWDFTW